MAESKKSGGGDSAVNVYARVRQIMPWEEEKLGIKWTDTTITNYGVANSSKEYKFTKALAPEMDNDEVFGVVIQPLIQRVLDGYNSLVIAYGQTGAGKTYTLCGKPKLGVTGMLTRSLVELLENPDVKEIKLRAMEAYGVKPQRIDLFDLLDENNHTGNWKKKQGNSRLQIESKSTNQYTIKTKQDCFDILQRAQQSSHFAPTGKNPESSRGHIVFVIDVKGENANNEEISSSMIFADLAGSEGDSALTDEFIASVTQETLLARKLESGVINVGLSELQLVFRDLMKKGSLSKSTGTGLIRMIKPYINQNTFISVVFCLSPSFINCASTEATLKFAAQACQLKTAPAKAERRINYENMAMRLKEELEAQNALVEKLSECISQSLAADETSVLIDKIKASGLTDLFNIDEAALSKKKKGRKHSVGAARTIGRVKSEAVLAVESMEADEQSWHVSRSNRKHRRMFSKHIDANQLSELVEPPLSPLFEVQRNDNDMVQELIEEAEDDENTRSWLAVMTNSLYKSRRNFGARVSAWGGRIELFFSSLGKRLRGKKDEMDDDDSNPYEVYSGSLYVGDSDRDLPGTNTMQSMAFAEELEIERVDSRAPDLRDLTEVFGGGYENTSMAKVFMKVDTENIVALDARE